MLDGSSKKLKMQGMFLIQFQIIDQILNIFEKRDLQTITNPFTQVILKTTSNINDETRLELLKKNPYSALIRLLGHQDDDIINDAIFSIRNILINKPDSSVESQSYPHSEMIQQCDGINKMFDLFHRNTNKILKDNAVICIGLVHINRDIEDMVMSREVISHLKTLLVDSDQETQDYAMFALQYLSTSYVNLAEILKGDLLAQIRNQLVNDLKGSEKQRKIVLKDQQNKCKLLSIILSEREGDENDELRDQVINSGIIDELFKIFATRNLNLIPLSFTDVIISISNHCNDELNEQIINKNPFPGLIRLLDHPNQNIVDNVIISIYGLIVTKETILNLGPHPHYNTIAALRFFAIALIGHLYKAREISDISMRRDVVSFIKKQYLQNLEHRPEAKRILIYLAENDVNRAEIEKGGFVVPQ
ncbi:MAG: hypothetical protein EZS28_010978 [Streblomastix strix]|uniref:Uncharacterized protein n=1 Tax=Streblomastix strix TaxID=222440 RepID=A0A5J4WF05_9EUKA|nr:MAG: hypothetical protein EZS28_010978 [Streblomastix strix]